MIAIAALVVLCAATVTGCSAKSDLAAAKRAVDGFHHQLDTGDFHAIYADADSRFHEASTEADFVKLLSAVHRKLGNSQAAEFGGWGVNYTPSGALVTLACATRYERGPAQEQFVWHFTGGRPHLQGYQINSNALITN